MISSGYPPLLVKVSIQLPKQTLIERHGRQNGTHEMVELLLRGREHCYHELDAAYRQALDFQYRLRLDKGLHLSQRLDYGGFTLSRKSGVVQK